MVIPGPEDRQLAVAQLACHPDLEILVLEGAEAVERLLEVEPPGRRQPVSQVGRHVPQRAVEPHHPKSGEAQPTARPQRKSPAQRVLSRTLEKPRAGVIIITIV